MNEKEGGASPCLVGKGGSWKAEPCAETGRGAACAMSSNVSS